MPGSSLAIADPVNLSNNCPSGTVIALPGSTSVSLNNAQLSPNQSCSVSIDVTGATIGTITTQSGSLTSSLGNSGQATASLTIVQPTISAQAPSFTKQYQPTSVGVDTASQLRYTISNPNAAQAISGLSFIETLPTGLVLASKLSLNSTTCTTKGGDNGILSGDRDTNTITFSGFSLEAGQTCTITANVLSANAQSYSLPTATLLSDQGISVNNDMSLLTVEANGAAFSKSFSPASVGVGERSRLTFTFDNSTSASDIGFLSFTDQLPTGMIISTPPNVVNTCNPSRSTTTTAEAASDFVSFSISGFAVPGFEAVAAGAICTLSLDVETTTVGHFLNVSSPIVIDQQSRGVAVATLEVTQGQVGFTQRFIDDPVSPGEQVTVEYTLFNPDRASAFTAANFNVDFSS